MNKMEIEHRAFDVLSDTYGSNITIPIDVELVAEISGYIFSIEVKPGLSEKFQVAAALCPQPGKKPSIFVDQDEFDYNSVRSRFSVAHELGHAILHSNLYEHDLKNFSAEEAVRFQKKIEKHYSGFEWQANYFAGALLMSHEIFRTQVIALYTLFAALRNYNSIQIIEALKANLAKIFDVSTYAAGFRLIDVELDKQIKIAAKNKFDHLLLFD